ncbi:MAG: hypothetical protein WAO02_02255 [Verrucomicrobiia bacterium]
MTQKNSILIALMLVLAGVYVVHFTDWFRPKTIQISHTARPGAFGNRPGGAAGTAPLLMFSLGGDYELTEIKVVPLAEWQANHDAEPVWHLVLDSNPEPERSFVYGQPLRGLKPAAPGAQPQPLQPNLTYRLFVTAGRARGWHDFKIGGSGPEAK